jgi:23S rRNA pseudouridine1911/1915/1917 synthase
MASDVDPRIRAEAREDLARSGIDVLHEDNHVLVLSKPAGLLSQAGPRGAVALTELIEAYRRAAEGKSGRAFVGLVHRLDRNVSGVMVIAKTSKAASRLSRDFRDRAESLRKTYLAWVAGRPGAEEGAITSRLRRERRVTREVGDEDDAAREGRLTWIVEGRGPRASRLRIDLQTGVSHQIRAQLAAAGHPLVGDAKYGGPPGPRPALHALRLAFRHPVQETSLEVTAPVPADLLALDRALRITPPAASSG